MESSRHTADLAAESLRLITLRYQAGESTALEVVDAQNTLITARNAYSDAEVRYRVALRLFKHSQGIFRMLRGIATIMHTTPTSNSARLQIVSERSASSTSGCMPAIVSALLPRICSLRLRHQGSQRRGSHGHGAGGCRRKGSRSSREVSGEAILYPRDQAALVPKVTAPVSKFFVDRGSPVHAGQVLAELENRDLASAVADNQGCSPAGAKSPIKAPLQKAQQDLKVAKEQLDAAQKVFQQPRISAQAGRCFGQGRRGRANRPDPGAKSVRNRAKAI